MCSPTHCSGVKNKASKRLGKDTYVRVFSFCCLKGLGHAMMK